MEDEVKVTTSIPLSVSEEPRWRRQSRAEDFLDADGFSMRVGGALPPSIRVVAEYPATDGSMPESVEVIWETNFPTTQEIGQVVKMLTEAPAKRKFSS
jgi:hypothetical protein